MPTSKQCYQCGHHNDGQGFCGACGSPLTLSEYFSKKVKEQLADTIRDRDVLEIDSSIKVFDQAWSRITRIFGIAVTLLVLAGGGVIWKASDFWSDVDKAKQSVNEQSEGVKKTTLHALADISKQTASFQNDLNASRVQLQAANGLQPEMEGMRKQLAEATKAIQAQQKVISSSEEFAKSIFSSHVTESFDVKLNAGAARTIDLKNRYAIIPPFTKETKSTIVFLLLDTTPIQGTLQLQQQVAVQPPGSYFNIHNLVVFFWGDPASGLETKPLSVSYFPDKSDTDIIHTLSDHDGRLFADDQPLPTKFDEPDPGFKGNKWMKVEGAEITLINPSTPNAEKP
jgi:hypothetical protein